MERGDFGLILQAAATGSFNFTNVGPMYFTRLRLVLDEMYRLNVAKVAALSALHCLISTVGADRESSEENYRRLQKNHGLFKKMLHFNVVEDDEATIQQRLIDEWYRQFGDKKDKENKE